MQSVVAERPTVRTNATFVLVGGEAYEWQGVAHEERELLHTSVAFVGSAYEQLRSAGVPREDIITIVQLQDYFNVLQRGCRGELTAATGIPAKWYAEHVALTQARCQRLLDEGGADYDFEAVNPSTVWSVLLGQAPNGTGCQRVVPADSNGAIVFGIYSHGDKHPAANTGEAAEWFAHFPYEATQQEMYDFVATEGAKEAGRGRNRPHNYLYCTQLRLIFHKIFARSPSRPIVGLLNYCLSGGNLEFMRRPIVRQSLGVDQWPLFLMSSSQASRESMVAGLWDAWFQQLAVCLARRDVSTTVQGLFERAESAYYQDNLYELLNAVKAKVYVPQVWSLKFSFPGQKDDAWDPWHIDLTIALRRCAPIPGRPFSFDSLKDLTANYESGQAYCLLTSMTPLERQELQRLGGFAADAAHPERAIVWTEGGKRQPQNGFGRPGLQNVKWAPYPVRLVRYHLTEEIGVCNDLAEVAKEAYAMIAQPDSVHGCDSGISDMPVLDLLRPLARI
mmetsp:Transcript_75328/g.156934  ORF Transcript_75328/g.156934 Transcript_75328/m.156934 type:complete len:505 (-) Transcript_75328:185-1699(-)